MIKPRRGIAPVIATRINKNIEVAARKNHSHLILFSRFLIDLKIEIKDKINIIKVVQHTLKGGLKRVLEEA